MKADSQDSSDDCYNERCILPQCHDGVQEANETHVDCGGPCRPCPDGEHCKSSPDCVNCVCMASLCLPATCMDGTPNGNETDVDCGGPDCPAQRCAPC